MRSWFLRNGQVFQDGRLVNTDVLILNGEVAALGVDLAVDTSAELGIEEIDVSNCLVAPGFVDLHVHLREPGFPDKETVSSGTRAAAAGGFTVVYAMPNTQPPLDSEASLASFHALCRREQHVSVRPIAAATRGRQGSQPVDTVSLRSAGVLFFSDDGDGVPDTSVESVMQAIAAADGIFVNHCEYLSNPGARFHPDLPKEAEYQMLRRDLAWVETTGCRYHAPHVSCFESVDLIRRAKEQGLPVTAEVTPHHLLLTVDDVRSPKGHFQMKPPLRTEADRQALIGGLCDGTIDAVATDHAPHGTEKEDEAAREQPFGVTGLETAFPALYTELVVPGVVPLETLVHALTRGPAAVTGESRALVPGRTADLCVVDLEQSRSVSREAFFSRGTNSPFTGCVFRGWPILTLSQGHTVYRYGRE